MRIIPDFNRTVVQVDYSELAPTWRIRFCLWADGIDVEIGAEGPTLAEAHAVFIQRLHKFVSFSAEEAELVFDEFRKGARKFVDGQIRAAQREEAGDSARRKRKRQRLLDLRKEIKVFGLGTFPQQTADVLPEQAQSQSPEIP